MVVGVALSAEIKREALESAEQKDDLEGAETIFLGKKLLLLKGLGLGGLALSQGGGFGGKFSGLIGGGPNSVDYNGYAPAYSGSYVAAPAPVPAPAPVVYSAPAPAPVTYSAPAPAPVTYSVPAPVTYSAPAPVSYVPAPVTYQAAAPAPVAYSAPAPVAEVAQSGYTGSVQVFGYLQPVQPVQPLAYSSQVSTGLYNAPPPPPPAPLPLAALPPCDH